MVRRLAVQALNRPALARAIGVALLALGGLADAHDYRVGALRIVHPYATPSLPGLDAAAVYLAVENKAVQGDRLLHATCDVARDTSLHRMAIEDGVMRTRRVDGIELPARATTHLAPGEGHHVMLEGLKAPLREGDRFVLDLRFLHAGSTRISVWVQAREQGALAVDAHLHQH